VVAGTAAEVNKNYAVVKEVSNSISSLDLDRVQLVMTDGTVATYYVNANSTRQVVDGTDPILTNNVVTYAIQADGSVKITNPADDYALGDVSVAAKQTAYTASGLTGTAYANSSTVYIFYGSSTIGVITGVNNAGAFDTGDSATSIVVPTTTGTQLVKYVFVRSSTSGVSTSAKYAYVTSAAPVVTVESSVTYYTYTVAIGGAITTLKTTQSSLAKAPYTYTTNTSGVSTLSTPSYAVANTVTVSYVDPAGAYVIAGGTVYTIDSSTVIYDITTSGAGAAATLAADQVVTLVMASDGDIAVAYITTQA